MATKTLLTAEEFDMLEPPDHESYELDEGELVVMPKPPPLHNAVSQNLWVRIYLYLQTRPIGVVLNPDHMYVLAPNIKRSPDVSFVSAERWNRQDLREEIQGGPDLAVEVLSPNDSMSATRRKIRQFFAAGTKAAWVIDPENRDAEVWEAGEFARVVRENETLTAPALLPGFEVRLSELLPALSPQS
ncbi:MAG: Uma2 family endonuclease [Bryobacteraceae bacterium]